MFGPLDLDWRMQQRAMAKLLNSALGRAVVRPRRNTRSAAPDDLLGWCRRYLPHHLRRPPSAMHRELARLLDDGATRRGRKLNVLGPRGSAKSTLVTLGFVLRELANQRQPYVWIVSGTRQQAVAHLANLRAELLTNARLLRAYPKSRPAHAAGGRLLLASGALVEAFGTGQQIRGRRHRQHRPTLIVCDDLQSDEHIHSARQRDLLRMWFHGMLLKAGTKRTQIVNLGTALHRGALSVELQATPGWMSRTFPSIVQWPTNMQLWHEWEAIYRGQSSGQLAVDASLAMAEARRFFEQQRAAMEAGAVVLWPEEEDLYTLMSMRAEGGSAAFEREKQCVPLSAEMCEWPEEYFDDSIWFVDWPSDLALRVMALDPSKGNDARRGDYSAFVLLGVSASDGQLYVEADLARRATPQIVAEGVELAAQFRPSALGIETNQFQSLLGDAFAESLRDRGLIGTTPWMIENRLAKVVRIRRLGPLLATGRLRFKANSPGTKLLVEQLRGFPAARHDDGPDALEMAVRLIETLAAPAGDDGLGARLVGE